MRSRASIRPAARIGFSAMSWGVLVVVLPGCHAAYRGGRPRSDAEQAEWDRLKRSIRQEGWAVRSEGHPLSKHTLVELGVRASDHGVWLVQPREGDESPRVARLVHDIGTVVGTSLPVATMGLLPTLGNARPSCRVQVPARWGADDADVAFEGSQPYVIGRLGAPLPLLPQWESDWWNVMMPGLPGELVATRRLSLEGLRLIAELVRRRWTGPVRTGGVHVR